MNHVTQVKVALKRWLLDTLPLKLVEADGAAADGVTTPPPYEIHTTEKADLGGLPSIEFVVLESTPQVNSYAQVYRHRMAVGYTVGGDDEERTTIVGERYMWALRRVARDTQLDPPQAPGGSPIDTGVEQYTPLAQRPGGVETPFVKGGYLEMFVTTVE